MKLFATSIILATVTLFGIDAKSQLKNAVSWEFGSKKVSDNLYEIHLTAKVERPWHIYSQASPRDGGLPTAIAFSKNPLTQLSGKIAEKGLLKEKYEEVFDVKVKYFEDSVTFVQLIKLKTKVKTNISGTVEFMACNDEQCLPPSTIPFTINLL